MTTRLVEISESSSLAQYEESAHLEAAVGELRERAAAAAPLLVGRRLWMVNSTATGGGVAEMLPTMISILRQLGVNAQWAVIGSDRSEFFDLTKRIHNLIHGAGGQSLTGGDRKLYESVSRENAESLLERLAADDLVVLHDPQPLGMAPHLKAARGGVLFWRCHIGLDRDTQATRQAWDFLEPYLDEIDQAVFTAREYVPRCLADRFVLIRPAIDPLSDKNRSLSPRRVMEVLCRARLAVDHQPVLAPPFESPAKRLGPDGRWRPACEGEEIGLLYRPVAVQISRWDRLKGFAPLLDGFVKLKAGRPADASPVHGRRLELLRLVLAGPDPYAVADDPEALEVLEELSGKYRQLPAALQRDVAVLSLPQHGLMVNALQSSATLVVQNSLQEGFGLTATEAMWKGRPVVGSRACGLRQQIRDGVEGRLVADPEDPEELVATLDEVLADPVVRGRMGRSGQRRVYREFLVFTQLGDWLDTIRRRLESAPGD